MKNVTMLFLLILGLTVSNSLQSQTITVSGVKIDFGNSFEDYGNLQDENSRIESDDIFVHVYESEFGLGCFYENKLYSLIMTANNNEVYPVNQEVEEILINIDPFESESVSDEYSSMYNEYFKTDEFYIIKSSMRMNTDYTIVSINLINEIREKYPDFLIKLF